MVFSKGIESLVKGYPFIQSFLKELPVPVLIFNKNFEISYQNKTATEYYSSISELKEEELPKGKSGELFRNKINSSRSKKSLTDFAHTKKNYQQILEGCNILTKNFQEHPTGPPSPINLYLTCAYNPDPTYHVQWQISLIPKKSSKDYEFIVIIICNTEIASLKQKLDSKEAELQSIFQASPLGIGIAEKRVMTSVNPYFCNMLGYSKQELLGKSARIVYSSEEEYARVAKVKHPLIIKKGVGSIDTQFKRKDGKLIDVFLSSAAKRNNDLSSGVIFTALNISELKKTQRALHESQKMLETVINAVPARIFWKDTTSTFLGCNKAFANDLGLSNPEMVIGKNDFDFFSRDSAEIYRKVDKKVLDSGKSNLNYLEHQVDEDGLYRWFRENKVPLFNFDGEIIGILGTYEDITNIHDSERKMAQIQDRLTHAQKLESLGRLAGGVAHEFNNLLTSILGYSELLEIEYPKIGGFLEEASRVITQNAKKGSQLTQQLLGFARIGKFNPLSYDVNKLIIDVLQISENFFSKSIAINHHLSSYPIICELDKTQFDLALTNLLLNARDAMPHGGEITIKSSIVDHRSEDWGSIKQLLNRNKIPQKFSKYARIDISDTGEGMTESVQRHIFEPFFTTKDTNKGTGLGLPTVLGIITNHEGVINLTSSLKEGTTFFLYLPNSNEQETKISESHLSQFNQLHHGSGTILIVDDELDIRRSLEFQLKKLGYQVLLAENGEDATEKFKRFHSSVDAILLDMVMPKMDGPECFANLKEIDPTAKIILISGFTQKNIIKEMINKGASGFLQKPFNFVHLSSILQSCLKKNNSNG